jgi:Ser/Thr protein kinase RdoA (MazF antagonist)
MSLSKLEHELILEQLERCYGIKQTHLRCLTDEPDDGVYGFTHQGQDLVVKYTLQATRSFSTIQGQVDWVRFLVEHGVPASRPVASLRGVFVEQLPINDTSVSAVCYRSVPGERPQGLTLTAELFQAWGQLLGKIHALSTRYTPSQQNGRVGQWFEGATRDKRAIPADQRLVIEKHDALMHYVQALPKDQQTYGLIHGDFQANNLRVDKGVLSVFDFDDCEYNWFVSDLATSLYFALWETPANQSNEAFASFALDNMIVGYSREHSIGADWTEQIPIFLKLQEMSIYVAINEYNQMALGKNFETLPEKHRALLRRYRHNIEHAVPYIESAYCPWTSD